MGRIRKLPESLVRLIAAGEVIERPASVLKELVENSLDAGATRLSVDLWGAGRSRIRVSDNGEGMTREDAELALERHATSKLQEFNDLHKILTFGFRGEALPSIAAVSRLELSTRTREAPEGWALKLDGGHLISSRPVAMPPGTTLDVQDLFFNTPARDKFLKKDTTERSHLLKAIQELALAHPHVGFEVRMDDKEVVQLSPAPDLAARLADLWGPALTQGLVRLEFSAGPFSVRGFVNPVPAHHPTKTYQALYINERPVQQRMLTHAIYEAYHEWLPVGRHPVFALFMDVDPDLVDVNVHPTKREVRCSNERDMHDTLFQKIRERLSGAPSAPQFGERIQASGHRGIGAPPNRTFAEKGAALSPTRRSPDAPALDFEAIAQAVQLQSPMVQDASRSAEAGESSFRVDPSALRILGIFQKLYIVAEQGEELLLIDQHAAAERVLYERFLARAESPSGNRQPLLTPYLWQLTPAQAETVNDALPALSQLGFLLEPFGSGAFALKEWPAEMPELKQAKTFLDLLLDALESESSDGHELAHHETVARAACRAAIKANDPVAPEEARRLLQDLAACQRPMTCPHGRPTHIRLPMNELHRRFQRT